MLRGLRYIPFDRLIRLLHALMVSVRHAGSHCGGSSYALSSLMKRRRPKAPLHDLCRYRWKSFSRFESAAPRLKLCYEQMPALCCNHKRAQLKKKTSERQTLHAITYKKRQKLGFMCFHADSELSSQHTWQ